MTHVGQQVNLVYNLYSFFAENNQKFTLGTGDFTCLKAKVSHDYSCLVPVPTRFFTFKLAIVEVLFKDKAPDKISSTFFNKKRLLPEISHKIGPLKGWRKIIQPIKFWLPFLPRLFPFLQKLCHYYWVLVARLESIDKLKSQITESLYKSRLKLIGYHSLFPE